MNLAPKSPTVADPTKGIRPLIFEYTDGKETLYGVSGSGFLLIVDESLFFVTANHAVGTGHELLRVPVRMGSNRLVPLKERYTANVVDGNEKERLDVTFFTLDPDGDDDQRQLHDDAIQALRISSFETFLDLWKKENLQLEGKIPLCAYGYPKSEQDVAMPDIVVRPCLGKMLYRGMSPITGSYEAFWDMSIQPAPDGMSGSPVFIRGRFKNTVDHVFVGMLTNASNGIAHFMSGGLVVQAIRQALRVEPSG